MNLAAIETFLVVVETKNLNKAAEQLNVTQSTITARLNVLEDALQQQLLIRSRKGARMTKAGFAFQSYAGILVQTWKQARNRINLPKGSSSIFSYACSNDLWHNLGEQWLADQQMVHTDTAFEVWTGEADQAEEWLQSRIIDAALSLTPITGRQISSRLFNEEKLIQVSTEQREAVEWDPAYIRVDHGWDVRQQHSETWPGDNVAHMSFSDSPWALDYLLKNGGSAYLPERFIRDHLDTGRLFPVKGSPEFTKKSYLSWHDDSAIKFPWLVQDQKNAAGQ